VNLLKHNFTIYPEIKAFKLYKMFPAKISRLDIALNT